LTEGAKKQPISSLGGRNASIDSLGGHPEKGWKFGSINCIFLYF